MRSSPTRSPYLGDCLGVLVDAGLAVDDPATVEEGLARSRSAQTRDADAAGAPVARCPRRLPPTPASQDGSQPGFKAAEALFRQAENAFWLAVTLLDHGEWLLSERRDADAEPLLAEAREIFERLKAAPAARAARPAVADKAGRAMTCPACGTENPAGPEVLRRVRGDAHGRLPGLRNGESPGIQVLRGVRRGAGGAGSDASSDPGPAPEAERRLVSVLFADLVGFTTLSEDRDPEEVRELLSRYFDTARQVIGRYGGTVEKFIGDAVMAVWGAPIAQEDDAERTVRAALDLVSAVAALGARPGRPTSALRAGVVTGEAAVTIGAVGQGMVAGDLVNTASRVQSVATPGTVFVGDATRRASEVAIDYEDAGEHELKGKAEPVSLWRAVRGRRRTRRRRPLDRPRGAVRRTRPRAAPRQGALPLHGGRGSGAPRLRRRRGGDR